MKRKSAEEKEKMIKEITKLGVIEGCRKFGISATTYYDWDRKYQALGIKGLSSYSKDNDAEKKRLLKENARLKDLLVEKDLKILMQGELLKKKMEEWKRKGK